MKTNSKKTRSIQGVFSVMMAFGLLVMLILPTGRVEAQPGFPPAPLFKHLTWNTLGQGERAFTVNGETLALSGTVYQAEEQFNLESSEALEAYYSSKNLAALGWQAVSTTPYPNGVASIYFHPAGVFAIVEFVGCGEEGSACLTVWQSDTTDIVPVQAGRGAGIEALGTLNKTSPANLSTNLQTSVTLTWTAYTAGNLNRYRYCIDTSNNNQCDAAGGWKAVWSGTSASVTSLAYGTTYYWQVQAVLDDSTKVDANGGTWWSFTTKVPNLPGAFLKTVPTSGATGQSVTPILAWQASTDATSYEYCIDTANNNICDSNWVSTPATSVTLMTGIGANITYYWQVRAVNAGGITYANSGTWFSFTTAPGPGNDTIDSAFTAGVPYENLESTISATIDTGTTNLCSPGLGFASVWYKYVATTNRRIYVDTFGTSYDTFMAVWTKNSNGTLNLVMCNDNYAAVTQSNLTLPVTNGTTYYIQVAQKNTGALVTSPGGNLQFHIRNFADVFGNSSFWKYIEGLTFAGITGGCATSPDSLYCPSSPVNRASMAVFLLRGIHGASYIPPAVGGSTGYADVSTTYPLAAWIKELTLEGITTGCGGGNYCPEGLVTRGQMAVFLLRSKHGASYVPPDVGGSTGFGDVLITNPLAPWIKQLVAEGITSGCGSGNYCPNSPVTRDQMAIFLSRTFSIPTKP